MRRFTSLLLSNETISLQINLIEWVNTQFIKNKKITRVEISRFVQDKDPGRYVYLVQIKT